MDPNVSRKRLDIYVTPECFGCAQARQLVDDLRRCHLSAVEVNLIDLSDPAVVRPAAVFAVPTYLLDGQILSLGNPDLDWLCRKLIA